MAEYLRILGHSNLTTSYADIYTVSSAIGGDAGGHPVPQAVVGSIILCETNNAAANVFIQVVPSGDTAGTTHEIFDTLAMTGNQTKIISPGIALSSGDKIRAKASTTNVNMFIFGSELI